MQINFFSLFVPVLLACVLAASAGRAVASQGDEPMNLVEFSPTVTTAGQPPASYFEALAKRGYALVVNLAPPESRGSLENEGRLVGETGMTYLNIPVSWDAPSEEHFEFFRKVMAQSRPMKTLVHCQAGLRASAFAFLFQVVDAGVPPDEALETMHEAWVPDETWTAFANRVLANHGIDYQIEAR